MRIYSRKVRFTVIGLTLVYTLALAALWLKPDPTAGSIVTVAIGAIAGMVAAIVAALGAIDHKQASPGGPTP